MKFSLPGASSSEKTQNMETDFEQLQRSTIVLSLPGLFVAALILGGLTSSRPDYGWALLAALGLILLIPAIWFISQWSFLAASLLLIGGSMGAISAAVLIGGIAPAAFLLFIPVGLTCMTLGAPAGVVGAALCSLLVLIAPAEFAEIDGVTRTMVIMALWATVGMIWLTLRPLLIATEWSWQAYRESQALLDQSRDFQMQLQQAMEDLTNTNTQLNRLNILANNLRQVAEDERRIKEQFVANVSHELRTPLNMIIGFSEMILKAPESYGQKIPTNLLADLQVVLRNSQHLSSLIDDVLDLSQIEAGQMALVKEWVSIPDIVQAVTIAVRPLFESKGLYLKADVAPNLPELNCDRTRIREVLLNLLSNAGRFTEDGGVTVKIRVESSSMIFSVTDTGPGISEEDRLRLFQPFQQLDATIRRRHGGTGLGLSISKSFVELHDGKMWVESEKGQGTTFFFRLPIEPLALTQSGFARWVNPYASYERRERRTSLPMDTRQRVLVVEKGSVIQRLLKRYLTDQEIFAVSDLTQARLEMERSPAQLVLLNDVRSPEDPFGLGDSSTLPFNTPVISCSIADPLQNTMTPDFPGILVKPIARDALLGALEKLVEPVKTILVVDDEPDAQKLFVRMLNSAGRGYRVVRAGNGMQALNILERQKVDVILLDLVMPEMDGFQFLKIKSDNPAIHDIPVILISALDPRGHPIVSRYLAVTRSGGLSVQQLLDCIRALGGILAPTGQASAHAAEPSETI
jgi:signal transduction histidine kinase/CheY-like chemotaxis protein